jgi:hypothetical protein
MIPWLTLAVGSVLGCAEEIPTGVAEGLLPVEPITIEIRLPWEQFATQLQVFGGFGRPSDIGTGLIANAFRGMDARTLGHWELLEPTVLVPDSSGTLVDSPVRIRSGRVVVFFDSLNTRPSQPVTVSANRTRTQWDFRTATWLLAVDSTGARVPWAEPGGGPAIQVSQGVWDPIPSDSLVLPVDSATVHAWTDTLFTERGFRIDMVTPDQRVQVNSALLRYDVVPTVDPDTLITREVLTSDFTFIYTPEPTPPAQGLRVGGAPAFRSIVHMQTPTVLTGPPDVCAALGCPFVLTPERINHASLVLQTRPSNPLAFQPWDSLRVDVRAVLSPEHLPKSPLGPSLAGIQGKALAPALFSTPQLVTIPLTGFVRTQLAGEQPDGLPPPSAVALLAFLEPAAVYFGSFAGPGEAGAPVLRLIVTNAPVVELP